MSDQMTWSTILDATFERRYGMRMRTPALVAVVVAIHVLALTAVMTIQGCGTTRRPAAVEPPPAPVMPPSGQPTGPEPSMTGTRPVFQPPVAVEPAPPMAVPTEGKTYTIQSGDSLSKIASRVGISARELAQLNNIKDPNKIRIGQKLVLPDHATPAGATKPKPPKPVAASKPVSVPEGGSVYVVQAGDNLSKIASRHGIKLSALREANKLSGDRILVGQKLAIPGAKGTPAAAPVAPPPPPPAVLSEPAPAPIAPPPPPPALVPPPAPASEMPSQEQPLDYTVQEGDSLEAIAKLFIVRQDDILKLNNISDPAAIKPGMKLKIPPTTL